MKSDLKYKEVWELKWPNEDDETFIKEIELVPFPIIIEPSKENHKTKKDKGENENITILPHWNPIIYKHKFTKEEFEKLPNITKHGHIMYRTCKILGNGDSDKGFKIWEKVIT